MDRRTAKTLTSSESGARTALDVSDARITLFGHTHEQVEWISNRKACYDFQPEFSSRLELDQYQIRVRHRGHNRVLLNPGSVGQPRDGDWRAAFAIYDDAELRWTWYRIPYDVDAAQKRILRAGLPEVLASRLRDGS